MEDIWVTIFVAVSIIAFMSYTLWALNVDREADQQRKRHPTLPRAVPSTTRKFFCAHCDTHFLFIEYALGPRVMPTCPFCRSANAVQPSVPTTSGSDERERVAPGKR